MCVRGVVKQGKRKTVYRGTSLEDEEKKTNGCVCASSQVIQGGESKKETREER